MIATTRSIKWFSILLICTLVTEKTYSQSDTTNKVSDTSKPVTQNQFENFKKDLFATLKEKDSVQAIGVLSWVKDSDITVYDKNIKKTGIRIKIDSIIITAEEGYILDIQVISGNRVFTNAKAPISITSYRFNLTEDILISKDDDESEYIYLSDILKYNSIRPFSPDDCQFVLNKSSKQYFFKKGSGLNTILDLRLYTDALGLIAGKSNGLIQVDARVKYMLHPENYRNAPFYWFHYIKGYVNIEKFDSKSNFTDTVNFSRSSLIQKSWFNAELSINIFEFSIAKKMLNYFYVDVGAGISTSNVAHAVDTPNVTTDNIFLEFGVNVKGGDNFGMNCSNRLFLNYSPQTKNFSSADPHIVVKPSIEAWWNPLGNKAGRVFARITYTLDTWNAVENSNHFFQFQFGYSVLLSKLLK